jgi:hypothetical protein
VHFKRYMTVIVLFLALCALLGSARPAIAWELQWKTVLGIQQTGDQVGVGTGAVFGGAPWATTGGSVHVDLDNGDVNFEVTGLILAVGSVPSLKTLGVPIGTPGPVTEVKGTLVCDVDGTANGGNSLDFDTPATTLSADGNAHLRGSFVKALDPLCSSDNDDAFVIRIVEPAAFAGAWIAFGAVRTGG